MLSAYINIQIKRMKKIFLPIILMSFGLAVFISAGLYLLLHDSSLSTSKEKFTIAITGDVENPYIELGMNALQTLDSSRYMFNLVKTSEDEARSLLRKKKIEAYIIIPEGFVEKVEHGDNSTKVTYVTQLGQRGILEMLKDQLAEIVSTLLIHAQSGIFAMENIVYSSPERDNLYNYNIDMNVQYVTWALDRTKFCTVKELGISNRISYSTYYIFSIFLLLIFMTGLTFTVYFTGRNSEINKRLMINGLGPFKQVLAEYLVYLFMIFVFVILISLLLSFLIARGILTISEYSYMSAGREFFSILKALIPGLLIFTTMQFLFYEFSSNVISSVIIQFTAILIFSYLGGFFYPLSFFPKNMQTICRLLPAGLALDFSNNIVLENFVPSDFVMTLIYTIVFFLSAVMIRRIKMEQ